jgi:hypothetical protein
VTGAKRLNAGKGRMNENPEGGRTSLTGNPYEKY